MHRMLLSRINAATVAALLTLAAVSMAHASTPEIESLCERIDVKLSSVSEDDCMESDLWESGAYSNKDTVLAFRDFLPDDAPVAARVLLIGGIHGDEYSSVTIMFRWLEMLHENLGQNFYWRVVPVLNPDGLLMPPGKSQRMNANGVDLNRNFPSPDWETQAHKYWIERTKRNKRRYPGTHALSEPESRWLNTQIDSFQPDAVIAVHAPHGVVDFDGPKVPPKNLGPLELQLLGTYPGSMGRYVGVYRGIPLLTVELESAFKVPDKDDSQDIWNDTIDWLHAKVVPAKETHDIQIGQSEGETENAGVYPDTPEVLTIEDIKLPGGSRIITFPE